MIKEQLIAEMREQIDSILGDVITDFKFKDAGLSEKIKYGDQIQKEVIEQYTSLNAERELPEPIVKVRGNYNVGYFTGRLDMLKPNEEGVVFKAVYGEW